MILLALTAPAVAAVGPDKAVYRLDFELDSTEAGKPVSKTLFSLTLPEERCGEAIIGDNIAVSTGAASERRNVGLQVKSSFELRGAALLLDVDTELTERAGASTIHKIATRNTALATPGKREVVMSVDHDKVHTELTVTATRL